MTIDEQLSHLHRELGLKQLNPVWAKIEIFLGLAAAGCGSSVALWATRSLDAQPVSGGIALGLILQILGWYLALAGHRSHLYLSQNKLIAYVVQQVAKPAPAK